MLIEVSLQQNNLTGLIPLFVGNLTNLSKLNLWGNKLSGFIPQEIGLLESLNQIDLSNNILTGEIPYSIKKLKIYLFLVFLGTNSLVSSLLLLVT
jgi:Leucine-rich repeat (LRR) protein